MGRSAFVASGGASAANGGAGAETAADAGRGSDLEYSKTDTRAVVDACAYEATATFTKL